MNPRLLRYFLAVVDRGGVGKAATDLHVAQPSVSQALRQLEDSLRVKLFERINQRLVLTDVGEAFVPAARRALEAVDAAEAVTRDARSLAVGRVRLVALPASMIDPVPRWCTRFRRRHPGVTVVAEMAFAAEQCYQAVRSGEADIALTTQCPDEPTAGIREHKVGTMELLIAAPPGTPTPGRPLKPADLGGCPFIAGRPGTWTREVLDQLVSDGHDVRIAADVTSRDMVVPLVASGVGWAFVAPQYARLAASNGAIIHRLDPAPTRDVVLVKRPQLASPAVAAFAELALRTRIALNPPPIGSSTSDSSGDDGIG